MAYKLSISGQEMMGSASRNSLQMNKGEPDGIKLIVQARDGRAGLGWAGAVTWNSWAQTGKVQSKAEEKSVEVMFQNLKKNDMELLLYFRSCADD